MSGGSLDHLVGEREQLGRDVEAERLGGNDTDDQLVLGWHLDGQVAWLRAFEDARHVVRAGAAIGSAVARAVAHQAASHDKLANGPPASVKPRATCVQRALIWRHP